MSGISWALADGEPRAQDGKMPLMLALDKGHEAIVGALLAAGANTEAKDEVKGGGGHDESGAVWCGSYGFRFERNCACTFVSL